LDGLEEDVNVRLKLLLSHIAYFLKISMLIKIRLKSCFETWNWAVSSSGRKRVEARAVDAGAWTKWSYFAQVSHVYPFVFSLAATVESSLL